MGCVAKTSPPCHGGGWERDISEQEAEKQVETCKKRKIGKKVFSR